ncbi:AAA family ATPase [Breznakiella homolactica]|uniref:AAA family ATPase n=1 Tax=Breznakiella homolactica TaxID=2798577 RepID=A0A7T7XPR9_9SPIR|nr:AAA family ATPase [Breznakiella homolactica]QQO10255.1 AAA family ATPase [Breznakiella homolactica]
MQIQTKPTFFIFSGLPGSGKSTLAKRLAREFNAAYLRADTVEQGLRDLCGITVTGEGYRLSYRIAADNLALGNNVVADSFNPFDFVRREWEQVALDNGAEYINIEVLCSDQAEHRRRVSGRQSEIPGLELPDWDEILRREYHPWTSGRIAVDTAGETAEQSFGKLLAEISARMIPRR